MNEPTPNKKALVEAIRSLVSWTPATHVYTVLEIDTEYPDWYHVEDENNGTSSVHSHHFSQPLKVGDKFEMTTLGGNILGVKIIQE